MEKALQRARPLPPYRNAGHTGGRAAHLRRVPAAAAEEEEKEIRRTIKDVRHKPYTLNLIS